MFKYIAKKIRVFLLGLAFGMRKADIEMLATKTQSMEGEGTASEVPMAQEGLLDDLKQGRVTQEVRQLRYKMYLTVVESAKQKISSITINDFTGVYNVETEQKYKRRAKGDPFDDYRVEIVLFNNSNVGELASDTLDRIDEETGLEKTASVATKSSITIERNVIPKLYIESYVDRLLVRDIDGEEKLLELYISAYPDPNCRRTNMLVKELEKLEQNQTPNSPLFDIDTLSFETINCHGIDDFYTITYQINSFDKIVKYNGFYIIKFKAELFNIEDFISEIYDETQANKYDSHEKKDASFDLSHMDGTEAFEENSLVGMLTKESKEIK